MPRILCDSYVAASGVAILKTRSTMYACRGGQNTRRPEYSEADSAHLSNGLNRAQSNFRFELLLLNMEILSRIGS